MLTHVLIICELHIDIVDLGCYIVSVPRLSQGMPGTGGACRVPTPGSCRRGSNTVPPGSAAGAGAPGTGTPRGRKGGGRARVHRTTVSHSPHLPAEHMGGRGPIALQAAGPLEG